MKKWIKELQVEWMKEKLKQEVVKKMTKPSKPIKMPLITMETLDKMDDVPMDDSSGG